MDKAIEAAAAALWRKHYLYGAGSVGEATAKPFSKVEGRSRLEYLDDAQAAITAYRKQREEDGFVEVPVEPTPAMNEAGFARLANHVSLTPEDVYRAMIASAKGGE